MEKESTALIRSDIPQDVSEDYKRGYQSAMEEARLHLFDLIVEQLHPMEEADSNIKFFKCGQNGDEILCEDEESIEVVADLLDAMGYVSITGSYDPKEDSKNGEVDELTGLYYCYID